MQKGRKRVIIGFFLLCACLMSNVLGVKAASNPYPTTQDFDGDGYYEVPCTWFVWQHVYNNLGIALPAWGNAGQSWLNGAANAGYSTGSTANANSIAVWTHHVSFVSEVSGNSMVICEGGNTAQDATSSHGIVYNRRVTSVVGQGEYGNTLLGFIYLGKTAYDPKGATDVFQGMVKNIYIAGWAFDMDEPKTTAKIDVYAENTYLGRFSADTPRADVGLAYAGVGDNHGFNVNIPTSLTGKHTIYVYAVNIGGGSGNVEIGHGTVTIYKDDCSNPEGHLYNNGTVTKNATCTAAGSKTCQCLRCNKTKTESIPALGHSYVESYTIDQEATCTAAGSKSRHCARCNAKSNVTVIAALGHNYTASYIIDQAATCTTAGSKSKHCTRCGVKADVQTIAATGHSWDAGIITKAATATTDGTKTYTCQNCGITTSETIKAFGNQPENTQTEAAKSFLIILSKTAYTYNGKSLRPKVSVYLDKQKLKSQYYKITYSNNKKVGIATVTVKGTGIYSHCSGTAAFKINPKKQKISAKSKQKSQITVKWKKDTQASGYELQVALNKKFTRSKRVTVIKKNKTTNAKISKLKRKKTYYVRLRSFKQTKGQKIYSAWSNVVKVKVK